MFLIANDMLTTSMHAATHHPTLQPMFPPQATQTATASGGLTAFYEGNEALRSRSVSARVLVGTVDIPAPLPKVVADWEREIAEQLALEPGDVEALPLPRTRLRWPDLKRCTDAATQWAQGQGLQDALASSDMALMACRGARYHHDAAQYGGTAFCNLFLSDDPGLDLHFPALQLRIPLHRGLMVVFDTGQPHAVIPRGRTAFDAADFPPGHTGSQVFLTWELALVSPGGQATAVAQALGVAFDVDTASAATLKDALGQGQLWRNGLLAQVNPVTGEWV